MRHASTPARLIPHLPAELQTRLTGASELVDTLEHARAEGPPLHVDHTTFRAVRRRLDASATAKLAARAADPRIIAEVATDRRTSVQDALARNPKLSAGLARKMLDETLNEPGGRSGHGRWERITALLHHLIRTGGPATADRLLRELATYCESGRSPMPADLLTSVLTRIPDPDMERLIALDHLRIVSGLSPLNLIVRVARAENRLPWGGAVVLAAIAAETRVRSWSRPPSRSVEASLCAAAACAALPGLHEPERLGAAVSVIVEMDRVRGGSAVVETAARLHGDDRARFDQNLRPNHALLGAAMAHCDATGTTLPISASFVTAFADVTRPGTGSQDLTLTLSGGRHVQFDDEAIETLATAPHSFGTDLLVLLAIQSSAAGRSRLAGRARQVDLSPLPEWYLASEHAAVDVARIIRDVAGGRPDRIAHHLGSLAEQRYDGTVHVRRIVTDTCRHLIESGAISIADLCGSSTLARILEETIARGSSGRRRPDAGDLTNVDPSIMTRILAAALTASRGRGDARWISALKPQLKDRRMLAGAALSAGLVGALLDGSLRIRPDRETYQAVVEACTQADDNERARHLSDLIVASIRQLDENGTIPWVTQLAQTVPAKDLRIRGTGEQAGRVEAHVLLATIGDDPSRWEDAISLLDTWDGTIAELSDTVRILGGRPGR